MAYCHKTTFLRSALLEDPFSLGDLLSPQEVLRIENEYPELFTPLEVPVAPRKSSPALIPSARLEKLTLSKQCLRSRCQPQVLRQPNKSITNSKTTHSEKLKPASKIGRPRSSPSLRPDLDTSSKLQTLVASLGSPNAKAGVSELVKKRCDTKNTLPMTERYSKDSNIELLKPVPTLLKKKTQFRTANFFQVPNVRKESVNLQPQRTPQSVRFQVRDESFMSLDNTEEEPEEVSASSFITKALGEFHFQVKVPRKSKSDSSSTGSTAERKLPDFIHIRSKGTVDSKIMEERETRLTKASMDRCEQLLLAKLLASKYENEGKFKKVTPMQENKRVKINENFHEVLFQTHENQNKNLEKFRIESRSLLKQIGHELICAEVTKILMEEKEGQIKQTQNVAVSTDIDASPPEKFLSSSVSEPLLTPTLTPPLPAQKIYQTFGRPKEDVNDINSASINTPSKTMSDKLENVRQMIVRHRNDHDITDCSELEDFVASEPIVKKTPGEPCITEVSTPEWPTPFSINGDKIPEYTEKVLKSEELQEVPKEFENLDPSELESSFGSILEIISEGEFIRSEGKSPGEISQYFSPGCQFISCKK